MGARHVADKKMYLVHFELRAFNVGHAWEIYSSVILIFSIDMAFSAKCPVFL
jgi:hypothetical protein